MSLTAFLRSGGVEFVVNPNVIDDITVKQEKCHTWRWGWLHENASETQVFKNHGRIKYF
jgi:hypothetical protein